MKIKIIIFLIMLSLNQPAFSQWFFDVVSFNEDNSWNIIGDPDVFIDTAYAGDCQSIPLYINFEPLLTMYSFSAINYALGGIADLSISLDSTIFSDRFEELALFQHDSSSNFYLSSVSDSLFLPPYFSDSTVKIAHRYNFLIDENLASDSVKILVINFISFDSLGYLENQNVAVLHIIIRDIEFERGDINHDSLLTNADISLLLSFIYLGGDEPNPRYLGDLNRDCLINIEDLLILRENVFNR